MNVPRIPHLLPKRVSFLSLSLSLSLSSISPFGALACAESQEELDGDEGSFITTSLSLMRKEGNEEKCQS